MDIGEAVKALRAGEKVMRTGWDGKDMFLYLVRGITFEVNRPPLNKMYSEGTVMDYRDHVDMRTAQGDHVPWVCSQSDLLADDWEVVA